MTLSKKTFFLLTLVILAIGACSPRKYVRGYMADETMELGDDSFRGFLTEGNAHAMCVAYLGLLSL